MTFLADALESMARQLADMRASSSESIAGGGSEQIEAADALRERSERVTARAGCRTMVELLQRCMLIDRTAARHYVSAAEAAHEENGLTSGEPLPGRFPELTAALRAGEISVAGTLPASARC
ncbi:hypothetical protein WDU99_09280 [Microbacterium sp. Mu-80]|uniref:DUF222 domain-containing protein n=1 Tax=Microbacterium bandirmense TaxID=3122050 RepID=A0ABU8LAY4_9MICO